MVREMSYANFILISIKCIDIFGKNLAVNLCYTFLVASELDINLKHFIRYYISRRIKTVFKNLKHQWMLQPSLQEEH